MQPRRISAGERRHVFPRRQLKLEGLSVRLETRVLRVELAQPLEEADFGFRATNNEVVD